MIARDLLIAVVVVGFVAGFVNTLAGSGSLLTLPMLMYLGLPANVANATNRVGILLQAMVGVAEFRRQRILAVKAGLSVALPAVVGSLLGARIAVDLDEEAMRRAVGLVMVAMLFVMMWRPERWLRGRGEEVSRLRWYDAVVLFVLGIYGGFIQAGVGILLLGGLVLGAGYDLVRANAIKVLITLLITIAALGVFISSGQVRWDVGALLAIGSVAGAWFGARLAVQRGAEFVRWVVAAAVAVSAGDLLGAFDFLHRVL
jgi:hypothetical protein